MQQILDAILAGDTSAEEYAALPLPESYRAVTVHKDEVDVFEGLASRDKDPRRSLHVEDVPLPELGPGEAYVAVMASAINYNTVWTVPAGQEARPALPRRRLGPRRRGAGDRTGGAHLAAGS
jgi:crotonyl-CoA reductase